MRSREGTLALALAVAALAIVGCGGNNGNKQNNASATAPAASASATRAAAAGASVPPATAASGSPVAQTAAAGSPIAAASAPPSTASQPTAASTGAAGQVEQKLLAALIAGGDIPSGLSVLNARQPLNNQQYAQSATTTSNVANFAKAQSDAGRVTGAVLNVAAPDASNPSGATSEITNLLVMLSDYNSPQQASAALPALIASVTPASKNPQAFTVAKQDVPLATIADQTTAEAYKISAVLGGQPDQLIWVVGVRRGAVDELYLETGVGGVPTQQQVMDLINRQDGNVAKAGL